MEIFKIIAPPPILLAIFSFFYHLPVKLKWKLIKDDSSSENESQNQIWKT